MFWTDFCSLEIYGMDDCFAIHFISGCNKRSSMGICWKYGILYVGTCFLLGLPLLGISLYALLKK